MLLLLSFPEVTAARFGGVFSWFNVSNDYCMYSDDGVDSGIRIDLSIPSNTYSLQFSILPTSLPDDFSALATNRVFFGLFNPFGGTIGLYLSENGGIALGDGSGTCTAFVDSADIFNEGLDYYTFRVTVSEADGRANLYVTRQDVLASTGVHELRYTFNPLATPGGESDNIRIEIVGTVADPAEICLDCFRFSSAEVISGTRRPVAVIDDDQARTLNQYGYFDGRGSYDPDTPPQPLTYNWTLEDAPESSSLWLTGAGTTPVDVSGYTNIINGAAGVFDSVVEGDLAVGDVGSSPVMRVASDGSWIALVNDVMAANTTVTWRILQQSCWGGARITGLVMEDVLDRLNVPPGMPTAADAYLVIAVAAGLWAGHEGEIATWSGAAWVFTTPAVGQMVFVISELESYRTDGGAPALWYVSDPYPWELDYWEGRSLSVGVILGDIIGLYTVSLVVSDSVRISIPAEALLNLYQNNIPLGLTPDLSFIWGYLSDFWPLVENRERVTTVWSAIAQLGADELMKLWQNDYSKSIMDIQRLFQRRWLNFDPWYEEPAYDTDPATIENAVVDGGYASIPTPVPVVGDLAVDAEHTYVLDAGDMPSGVTSVHYLVLDGIAYRIARTRGDSVITSDVLSTTDRSNHWMVKPSVTSKTLNFSSLGVAAGDSAVFEIRYDGDTVEEIPTYIWGVRGSTLIFEDRLVSAYISDDDYEIYFKGVLRRSVLAVDDLVVGVPRLQEVININGVDGAPAALIEGNDFRVEVVTTIEEVEVNTIQMLDTWFPVVMRGYAGATINPNHEYFDDATVDFEVEFGVGADLRGYVLELSGVSYRLYQVVSATRIELEDSALQTVPALAGERWKIRSISDPPDVLWAEVTYLDNRPAIETFGKLVGFTLDDLEARTGDLDYLSAVQGLWYYVWGARTLYRTRVGSQIILGLPFAESAGTITEIRDPFDATRSRIVIQDTDNLAIYRTYLYPTDLGIATNPDTSADYTTGDVVERFAPLSGGVTVTDYVDDPDWFSVFVGSGDFYEPEKLHRWGVIVDADAFDLVNLLFLISYLRFYKPKHTDPFFAVVKEVAEIIDVADPVLMGPMPPVGYTYPDSWNPYTYPPSWADSPHEVTRAAITSHYPTTPPVPTYSAEFGGLRLSDAPALCPDGWAHPWVGPPGPAEASWLDGHLHAATRSEGSFRYDETDESGHPIHRFDDHLASVNLCLDDDMEDGLAPGAPGSPWALNDVGGLGLAITAIKSNAQNHTVLGADSLYITSLGTHTGVEQVLAGAIDTGFQVTARFWVYRTWGQAYFRLLDQDNPQTVLAEWRHGTHYAQWHQITLHAWSVSAQAVNNITIQMLTGPAGGTFYVDDIEICEKLMPWNQWGYDKQVCGRTGNYTFGGSPDEDLTLQLAIPVP